MSICPECGNTLQPWEHGVCYTCARNQDNYKRYGRRRPSSRYSIETPPAEPQERPPVHPIYNPGVALADRGAIKKRVTRINSLSELKSRAAIAELAIYLASSDIGIRLMARDSLINIGGRHVEKEVKALLNKDISNEAREEVKEVLYALSPAHVRKRINKRKVSTTIKLEETKTEYLVAIPASQKERAKRIKPRRWDVDRKRWVYPRNPNIYMALIAEFGKDAAVMKITSPDSSSSTIGERRNR